MQMNVNRLFVAERLRCLTLVVIHVQIVGGRKQCNQHRESCREALSVHAIPVRHREEKKNSQLDIQMKKKLTENETRSTTVIDLLM